MSFAFKNLAVAGNWNIYMVYTTGAGHGNALIVSASMSGIKYEYNFINLDIHIYLGKQEHESFSLRLCDRLNC